MPGFGEDDFEFAAGTVQGIRYWNMPAPPLTRDPQSFSGTDWQPVLRGMTGKIWGPETLEAACNYVSSHLPPVEYDLADGQNCGCGIWAYWDIRSSGRVSADSTMPVAGIISGTGRVIVGEKGFRSQRGKIIALAPAFSIQAQRGSFYDPNKYYPYKPANELPEECERELTEAQQNADAWMGIIQDRIRSAFPEAQVFGTVRGMLASVRTGEIS